MFKLSLIVILLITSVFTTLSIKSKLASLKSRAIRLLQEAEKPGSTKDAPESTKKKTYTPFKAPSNPDNFKSVREDYYKHEEERLNRERTFHSSEFQRYVRQQKWNDDRKAIETDNSKTIADRVRQLMELDEQARIDIDTLNAGINLNQQLRNPQNRRVARAWRIFMEAQDKVTRQFTDSLQTYKIPKQGVEDNGTRIRMRRNLQAVKPKGYTAAQKADIKKLEDLWVRRRNALQAQIDLNTKFHTVEFYEFAYDEHRLEDTKAVYESNLSWSNKWILWNVLNGQYNAIKAPAKKLINDSNNARKQAQNVVNQVEGEYINFTRSKGEFRWATQSA